MKILHFSHWNILLAISSSKFILHWLWEQRMMEKTTLNF